MTAIAETMMLAYGWRRFLLVLAAGAMAGLSVPPLFVLPALFLALPIWVWALDGAERLRGWRRIFGPAFTIGFAFGLGYFLIALHWLGTAFFADGGVWLAAMPFALLALAAVLAVFWGLASTLAHLAWSGSALRIVILAALLATFEFGRGHLFSGFPFDLLGYALTANDDMAQLASVVGVYGLTLLAALVGMTPALVWPADDRGVSRRLLPLVLSVGAIAAQIGYGHVRLASTELTLRADTRMRLVQPLVTEHTNWEQADPAAVIERLIGLSQGRTSPQDPGLSGVTQIVWPESSLPFFLSDYPEALARIGRMLPPGAVLLTGAPRDAFDPGADPDDNPGFNAILAIDDAGEIVASYDKSHLVPFGEYLPFSRVFGAIGLRQFVPGSRGWAHGDGRRLLAPPGTPPFLALICYEALFSGDLGADLGKAEFILNITNDSWFDGSIGPAQHAHHARLRAVEEGIPMVRVGNSGVTMLVDPLGRVTARLAEQEIGVLDVVPAHRLPETVFGRFGHWPFWGAILVGLAVGVGTARRARFALA